MPCFQGFTKKDIEQAFRTDLRVLTEEMLAKQIFWRQNLQEIMARSDTRTPDDLERAKNIAWERDAGLQLRKKAAIDLAKDIWASLEPAPPPEPPKPAHVGTLTASSNLKDPKDLTIPELIALLGIESANSVLQLGPNGLAKSRCGRCSYCLGTSPGAVVIEGDHQVNGCLNPPEDNERRKSKLPGMNCALGFDSNSGLYDQQKRHRLVEPQETILIASPPQLPFRPRVLAIPRHIAPHFIVNDVRSGKNSIAHFNAAPLPSEAFSLIELNSDTLHVGQLATVNVTNISKEPRAFRAAMLGTGLY